MDEISVFELSSVVQNDLLSLNDAKTPVSLDEFDVLLQIVCDTLTEIPNTHQSINVIKKLEEKLGRQKIQLYTSLSSLFIKAASEKVSTNQLEAKLNALNCSVEQITRLLKMFSTNQSKIQAILKLYGPSPPKLVDVNWRLDYQVETNTRGPVQKLIYFIDLILEDKGRRELLSFTASHAELEDLVNTLKDACQSVKRVALL
ncbi:COMM domain-containing protein 3-like [Daphnia pulex]|uniref:COMM domain-containing protein 3-like n=1 Tax=Daphnia pulex TaxID=6669 RepID=UPI001EE0E9D0|nr:COMM domain-containing protein 3-like [Daphnia pulex]XP_046437344.1 COMM domain-containing protein 3-like [Daphnia pulex]